MSEPRIARALTIAGSDSGGGAGIEADLKTFTALGVYGMVALTSVTAQDTVGVAAVHDLPPSLVAKQIDVVASDIGVDAAKTGMLSNAAIIEAVAERLVANAIRTVVVDPVMVAKGGHALLEPSAIEVLKKRLLPVALVVTPNIPEAGALAGMTIRGRRDIEEAARSGAALRAYQRRTPTWSRCQRLPLRRRPA
jgi:hydroxymethylpyrimidine/phosphomethylpyrimidine kinase